MEGWKEFVSKILGNAPTRVMPFSNLLGGLKAQGIPVEGRERWIFGRLKEDTANFRVIPERLGPWLYPAEGAAEGAECGPGSSSPAPTGTERALPGDPWIMDCSASKPSREGDIRIIELIRESILAWGLRLDAESQTAVATWIEAVDETERAVSQCLLKDPRWPGTDPSTTHPPGRPPGG